MTIESIMENKEDKVDQILIQMASLIQENAALNNFFGYREQIEELMKLNNFMLKFIDKYSIDYNLPLSEYINVLSNIDYAELDIINESSNFIILNHLALTISNSSYESTLSFVKSRSMWNQTLNPATHTINDFVNELNIVLSELTFGSSAMLRAKLKGEVCSEFTIKPLFKFVALFDLFFLGFEE